MSFWSDVRIDLLRALVTEGASAGQAARELGGTRSQMIGKAARIGLRFHSIGGGMPVDKSKTPRVPRQSVPRQALPRNDGGRVAALFVGAPDRPEQLVSLFDLRVNDCRFPYGSPESAGFGFCGRAVRENSSYCPGHHALCRVPVKKVAETKAPASWERRRA